MEGVHFTAKMPKGGKAGYVYILKEGMAYAAWLSVHGSEDQRKLAAEFVKYILQRAWEAGKLGSSVYDLHHMLPALHFDLLLEALQR